MNLRKIPEYFRDTDSKPGTDELVKVFFEALELRPVYWWETRYTQILPYSEMPVTTSFVVGCAWDHEEKNWLSFCTAEIASWHLADKSFVQVVGAAERFLRNSARESTAARALLRLLDTHAWLLDQQTKQGVEAAVLSLPSDNIIP